MCDVMCERSPRAFNMSCVRSIKSFKNWAEKGLRGERALGLGAGLLCADKV